VAIPNDLRRYPRLSSPKGTFLAWQTANKRVVSDVVNLGLGGLYIRTPEPPPLLTFIQLLLDVPAAEVRARRSAKEQSQRRHGREVCRDATRRSSAIRSMAEASIKLSQT